jgi:2-polyprenyl-3-methyl-5-hydroxy-6-metoxy-1,4-benzoquinol methylase
MQTEAVPACPACGGPRREPLYEGLTDRLFGTPGSWRLQRCSECGAAYLDPRPTRTSIASAYESYYTHEDASSEASSGLRARLRNGYLNARYGYSLEPASALGRIVVPLLPGHRAAADRHVRRLPRPRPGARVLDVGCGNGEFLLGMRAAGWTVEGVETDSDAVSRARQRSLSVHHGTLESAGYAPGSFDAVTLSHVLEHLHDPVATLRAARAILRDDGVLWLATPNLASPGHARYGRAWRGLEPPRHLVLFTPSALRSALDRADLRVVAVQPPATSAWVYEASESLAREGRARTAADRARLRLATAATAVRSTFDHRRGEELVVLAKPV